jgi:hypothetical protein
MNTPTEAIFATQPHGGSAVSAMQNSAENPVLPIELDGGFKLNLDAARKIGEGLSAKYTSADPFPHIVLDNFLPEPMVRLAQAKFPVNSLPSDTKFESGYAGLHKRQILPEECAPEIREMFHFFNSAPILKFLEGLTGIEGLIADPYFDGGGYHETKRGGLLGVHADFRVNERLHVHRRINVIIYLNDNWKEEYGGHLGLWDRQMKGVRSTVAPIFNRCVIFNTDADSFHGHPDPLTTPEGVFRRSMALYYYTASKLIYKEVPNHGTIYHARPGDSEEMQREARKLRIDQHLGQWVPPIMQRWVFALKNKLFY